MLLTSSGLGGDWEHHLWYVWQQSLSIRANGVPSFFVNTPDSVFYPQYAFYGGTINALAGALAIVFGESPIAAYVLTYILGFAATYGGWYWLSRGAGLGRWLSHAPALLFVTSGCYLSLVYGEGDWAEFLGMSMIPLMVAAGVSVLRAEHLRFGPAFALVVSSIVFFGSHDLTTLWASTFALLMGAALLICVPGVRRLVSRRGLLRLAALVIPAALVNAWFLLPTLAYASHTKIGSNYAVARITLHRTMHLVSFAHLFTLSRASTLSHIRDYVLALPTLAIAWVLVSIAILLIHRRGGAWVRMLVIFSLASTAIAVLMTHVGLLLTLPKPYTILQFSYRLESYVLMGVTAAVLAVLVITRSGSSRIRIWSWALLPVLVLSAVGAVQQVDAYPRRRLPREAVLGRGGEIFAVVFKDYGYAPLPLVGGQALPRLAIYPNQIHGNSVSVALDAHPGQMVDTNIGGGPDLLHITGASVVGRDVGYHLVLALDAGPAAPPSARPTTPRTRIRVSIALAQSLPVVLGRILTLIGAVVLVGELSFLLSRVRKTERVAKGARARRSEPAHRS
jgi:hypothetical protein